MRVFLFLILLLTAFLAQGKTTKESDQLWIDSELEVNLAKKYSLAAQVAMRGDFKRHGYEVKKYLLPRIILLRKIAKGHKAGIGGAVFFKSENSKVSQFDEFRYTLQHEWKRPFWFIKKNRNRLEIIDEQGENFMPVRMRHRFDFVLVKAKNFGRVKLAEEIFYFLNPKKSNDGRLFSKIRSTLTYSFGISKTVSMGNSFRHEWEPSHSRNNHDYIWLTGIEVEIN